MRPRPFARAARALAPVAALFGSCLGALADEGDFTRLAPPKPVVMVSVPDFAKLHASFDASALGKLMQEPSVQKFVEAFSEDAATQASQFLKELGMDSKDLKPPTGAAGFAMYMVAPPEGSEKRGQEPVGLFAAEAGENAQGWKDLIEKLTDRAVKDKMLTTEEDSYAGATVTTLKPVYKEPNEKPARDEMDPPEPGAGEDPVEPDQNEFASFVGGTKDDPRAMHLAWSGATLMISTHLKTLEHALDAAAGKEVDSLSADAQFKAALAQHPEGMQGLMLLDVRQLLEESMRDAAQARRELGGPPLEADPAKIVDAMGIGGLSATTLGLRLDSPDALAEVSIGVLVAEKKGILALMADAVGPFDPPAFVPPDAAGVTRFSFRLDKLYDFLRTLPALMPEGEGAQFAAILDQGVNMVKPALDAAGPNVWVVQTLRQPLAADSAMVVAAIELKDQATVGNTLSFYAGLAQGVVEAREFEGNTVYTSDTVGLSAGLGFGHLFIGHTPAVENSMRLAGRAGAPRIGSEPGFKAATRTFGADGAMHSFSDIAQALREMYWSFGNMEKEHEQQLDTWGLPADQKDAMMKQFRESIPAWMNKLPPIETVLEHIGDSSSEMRPTPDGFRGRLLLLKPIPK